MSRPTQRELAKLCNVSAATINLILNKGVWPKKGADELKAKLAPYINQTEMDKMLRKQTLLPQTRQFFKMPADPFGAEIRNADDLFLDDNLRYVREAVYMTAKHGGMLAVVGESGSGKSTLRRDFLDRLKRESLPVVAIEPYIISMDDEPRGKPLRADHIAEAIIHTVAPLSRVPRSPEQRFRLLHKLLKESARAGNRHVLIIEEAHDLHGMTLKHLKRFYELEDGFDRLLAIVLFGQTELRNKLGETNAEVREVVQRMELVELHAMTDPESYIRHRLERAGLAFEKLFGPDAVDALRSKHSGPAPARRIGVSPSGAWGASGGAAPRQTAGGQARESVSLLYPLAVCNTLAAAFNLAAEIGMDKITGDIIRRV